MKLLLREDVDKLGSRGQVVTVAEGYARNYLIPRQIALEVNPGNLRLIESEKKKIAVKELKHKEELDGLKKRLEAVRFMIKARVSEEGHLYGSVAEKDIVSNVHETIAVDLDAKMIRLVKPIKETGLYDIPVHLHAEVVAHLKVWVVDEEGKEKKPADEAQEG